MRIPFRFLPEEVTASDQSQSYAEVAEPNEREQHPSVREVPVSPVEHPCHSCQLKFATQVHLDFHSSWVHSAPPLTSRPLTVVCPCTPDTYFLSPEDHLAHLRAHHAVTVYICHLCPKAFKNRGTWTVHQRMFHGDRADSTKVLAPAPFPGCKARPLDLVRSLSRVNPCMAVVN
jgi:hypothetical protein